jgi:putative peptidoglycan lipid II flippase
VRHRALALLARYVPSGAAVLSVLTFGSYVMGLLRDRIFARSFGVGSELDIYNAAFVLPEVLLDVLVESGLAAAFIPIFLALRNQEHAAAGDRFARTILTGAIGVMGVTAIVLFVLAEGTTELIAPGFTDAQHARYVDLFRVMLATPILFAASLTLGNVLLAEQRFAWYGVAPLLYNAGIIAGTLALAPTMGIYGPAIGAVLGALLHLGSRLVGLRRSAFRIGLATSFRMPAVGEFVRLMIPRMVSHPIESTTFLFFTRVASGLAIGSVTAVSFARNFQSVPVTVLGIAFALAAFPALSTAHARGNRSDFLRLLGTNLATIVVLTTGAALVLAVAGELVIGVFLGGGAMTSADVARTAAVLAAFTISIPFESVTHLLSRAIFATRHTLLQVLASLTSLAITVAATLLLVPGAGLLAVPFGFAIGQAAKVLLLSVALAVRLRATRWAT